MTKYILLGLFILVVAGCNLTFEDEDGDTHIFWEMKAEMAHIDKCILIVNYHKTRIGSMISTNDKLAAHEEYKLEMLRAGCKP